LSAKDAKDQGFSGKWNMDKKASHGSDPIDDLHQDIKQSGTDLYIQSRFAEPKNGIAPLVYLGIMTTTLKLSTNGEEVTNQIGPFVQTTKTTLDGNKLTTDWHAVVNGDPVEGKWVRTLSEDGKTMTLEITESSTHGQKGDATITFKRK
jgi:hypothetical protein